jgi:hypothetical protein
MFETILEATNTSSIQSTTPSDVTVLSMVCTRRTKVHRGPNTSRTLAVHSCTQLYTEDQKHLEHYPVNLYAVYQVLLLRGWKVLSIHPSLACTQRPRLVLGKFWPKFFSHIYIFNRFTAVSINCDKVALASHREFGERMFSVSNSSNSIILKHHRQNWHRPSFEHTWLAHGHHRHLAVLQAYALA